MDQPASPDAPHGRPRSRLRELNIILGSAVLVALLLRMFVLDAYHIPTSSMEPALMAGDFLLVNKLTFGPRTPASLPLLDIRLPVARLPAFEHPRRGDVMLLEMPEGWSHQGRTLRPGKFVKRVAGVPGDTLTSAGGELAFHDAASPRSADGSDASYSFILPRAGEEVSLTGADRHLWEEVARREGSIVGRLPSGETTMDGVEATTYRVKESYYVVLGDNREVSIDSRQWGPLPERLFLGKAIMVYWSSATNPSGRSSIRWARIGNIIR